MECLHDLFSVQAQATPDAIAVVDQQRELSYSELDDESDRLAALLRENGVGADDTVGLFMEKSVDYVTGCLAALKAGGAFLPLFLDYPESLLSKVLEQTKTKVILTTSRLSPRIPASSTSAVVKLDALGELPKLEKPLGKVSPENLMFVVYTSGTTGEPKGIQLPHRAAVHSYQERYKVSSYSPGQRVACNIFFVWEIFRPLLKGAAVHVIPDDIIYDPKRLASFLKERKITEVLFTPSLMETMLNHLEPSAWRKTLKYLQVVWLNGEVVTEKLRTKALQVLDPKVGLFNTYSISECHDVASLDLREAEVSRTEFCRVGYPIDGITVHLMDQEGSPVPTGEQGELYVGGPGLSRGYLGKPHLTAERFLDFRGERLYRTGDIAFQYPDGLLEIRGRCDSMVKIRGYSVHLGAVQSCLEKLSDVKSAAVVAVGEEGRDKRLVAYIVPTSDKLWSIDPVTGSSPKLRERLREHLSEFMLPNYFMEVDTLPLSPITGKFDTKLLPSPPVRQQFATDDLKLASNADYHQKEALVAKLWERLLGLDPGVVKPHSNFFDLGGHSLMAVRCTQHVERITGCSVSVKQLYNHPTVKQLTNFIHTGSERCDQTSQSPPETDWTLAECIRPTEPREVKKPSQAEAIFVTGGTGFLGAFVIDELLRSSDCPIYCLVRPGAVSPQQRLEENLKSLGLQTSARLRAIGGDLSKTNFGLNQDDYESLCKEVDLVFHCGAAVNYVHSYAVLKPHTVDGTRQVLQLCCSKKTKTLHYISTNGVFAGGETYQENDEIDGYLSDLSNGYGHSKWVAEKLVWQAVKRGLPATLYRPGNIGHHTETAAPNQNDFQYLLLRACLETSSVPPVEDWFFEMTPVDFLSRALIAIAESGSQAGRVFNIVQHPTTQAQAFFDLLQGQYGLKRAESLDDWTQALLRTAKENEDSKFEVLANSLADIEGYLKDQSHYESRYFDETITSLGLERPEAGLDYLRMLVRAKDTAPAG